MFAKHASAALMLVSLALGGGIAQAQNTAFLRDDVMSFLKGDDTKLFAANFNAALELPDGHTHTWNNPKTGASGTATPLSTSKNAKGMTCRNLALSTSAGGRTGQSRFEFCKTPAGWRATGN
jgi:surface antigen